MSIRTLLPSQPGKLLKSSVLLTTVTSIMIGALAIMAINYVMTFGDIQKQNRELNIQNKALSEQLHRELGDMRARDQADHREQLAYMRCLYLLATGNGEPSAGVDNCVRDNLPPADDSTPTRQNSSDSAPTTQQGATQRTNDTATGNGPPKDDPFSIGKFGEALLDGIVQVVTAPLVTPWEIKL